MYQGICSWHSTNHVSLKGDRLPNLRDGNIPSADISHYLLWDYMISQLTT